MKSKLKYKNRFNFFCYSLFVELKYLIFSDEKYRKIIYKKRYNQELDLDNPQSFNEKIAYRTLYQRDALFTKLADKLLVRDYVKERIGDEYLIKLIDVFQKADDINLDILPDNFVLKCNHDVGSVVICKDKNEINFIEAKNKLDCALKTNVYKLSREWQYKDIKPVILCEELHDIFSDSDNQPEDYKFHCFNGKVKYIEVQFSRFGENRFINIYDENWSLQPFKMGYENTENKIQKPERLEELIGLADLLANGIDYCRVDFYITKNNEIKFGEITFTPCNGLDIFIPSEWQFKFAEDWIVKK